MITKIITAQEAGRRLDKYLQKVFSAMPASFMHRQLRGNGFRLNGRRIHDGSTILQENDQLDIYLSDAQLQSFGYVQNEVSADPALLSRVPPVIYEDDRLVIFDKPYGLLSQKDKSDRPSLTEIARAYLQAEGLKFGSGFLPGVLNRLDFQTSGLVMVGKTLAAQQALSQMIREDRIDKFYYAIVEGQPAWDSWTRLVHSYRKDEKKNRLLLSPVQEGSKNLVVSEVRTVSFLPERNQSLVEIRLITGKSHQIRAQLSFEGFPISGDPKYNTKADGHKRQLLCAKELWFRDVLPPFLDLKDRHFYAVLPQDMNTHLGEQTFH